MSDDHTPKIIVDDDWKSQARAEKERLAKQAAEKATRPAPFGAPPAAASPPGAKPSAPRAAEAPPAGVEGDDEDAGPVQFDDLIRLLATQALMYLGAFPDPQTGRAVVALDVAKVNIDLLAILEEKTKGNLTEDEAAVLKGTSHELRMQYVEVARAIQRAVAEGRLGADGTIRPAGPAPGQPGIPGSGPRGAEPRGPMPPLRG